METATEIIISSYLFTEDNQATMTNNKSDSANGKEGSSSPAAPNSTDAATKKKKRNKKKNSNNNNNNTKNNKKEVFKGTAKDGTMLGVVVTTEVGNMAGQYRVFMKAIQQYCSSKGYATLPTCIETLTPKTEADFAMTPIDTTLFASIIQKDIPGSIPPSLETTFAVFDPVIKKTTEMEWNVNFKLKREE